MYSLVFHEMFSQKQFTVSFKFCKDIVHMKETIFTLPNNTISFYWFNFKNTIHIVIMESKVKYVSKIFRKIPFIYKQKRKRGKRKAKEVYDDLRLKV